LLSVIITAVVFSVWSGQLLDSVKVVLLGSELVRCLVTVKVPHLTGVIIDVGNAFEARSCKPLPTQTCELEIVAAGPFTVVLLI